MKLRESFHVITYAISWLFLFSSSNVYAFYQKSHCPLMITHPKFLQKSFGSISTSILSQRIEQDFQNRIGQPLVVVESAEAMIPNVFSRLSNAIGFAKRRFAKAGAAFGLTYIIISNLNGSISLSLAWYMASKQVSILQIVNLCLSICVPCELKPKSFINRRGCHPWLQDSGKLS